MLTNSLRILLVLAVTSCGALCFGIYEIIDQGFQISEQEANLRRLWASVGCLSFSSLNCGRLATKEWRKLIAGLDTNGLPTKNEMQNLRHPTMQPEVEWIVDMSEGFWQSGFCHNRKGQAANAIGIVSGVASAGLLGIALFNPFSGLAAIGGIATGSVSLGSLLHELFSLKRFQYWEDMGPRIKSRWTAFSGSTSLMKGL